MSILAIIILVLLFAFLPQVFIGLVVASLFEYYAHMLILHKMGRKKNSFFAHHWSQHHRLARKYKFYDSTYHGGLLVWNQHGKELFLVMFVIVVHSAMFFHFPIYATTVALYALTYLYIHRRMHLNPSWGRKYFPWHWDHHMGLDQDQNWGILTEVWDIFFDTREYDVYDSDGRPIKKKVT